MMDFDHLASATVQIVCGQSSGSGFRFCRPNLVVTNRHVIEPHLTSGAAITARSESSKPQPAKLIVHSAKTLHDFAILETGETSATFLWPAKSAPAPARGDEVAFAGFPHGVPDLLVQRAMVSGHFRDLGFYIDGSVNGGNSGGPVVSAKDGALLGIITARRFPGGDVLDGLAKEAEDLRNQAQPPPGIQFEVRMGGMDALARDTLTLRSLGLIGQVIAANANAGLGIFFKIAFVFDEAEKLKLI